MAPFISVWSIDIFCWGNSLASPGTRMKDTLINYHLFYEDHHTEVIFFCLLHGLSVKLPRKYHFPCERFSNSQLLSWYDKKQSLEKSCMCTSWKGSRATLSLTLANHHPKILQWELMQSCKSLRDGYNERIQQNILVWFPMKIWFQKYFPIGITKKALYK